MEQTLKMILKQQEQLQENQIKLQKQIENLTQILVQVLNPSGEESDEPEISLEETLQEISEQLERIENKL